MAAKGLKTPLPSGGFWPRLCKNVVQYERYSKPDWKPRFYAKSTSADVPINFRFNVEAPTSILATRFYTLWTRSGRSPRLYFEILEAPTEPVTIHIDMGSIR